MVQHFPLNSHRTLIVGIEKNTKMMNEKIRTNVIDAIKRITESTWRGREHTPPEIVNDIKNFLTEENETVLTEIEWQELLDQFPIVDLSGNIFKVKDIFAEKYGYGSKEYGGAPQSDTATKPCEAEPTPILSDNPIEKEQELIKQLREVRKQGVKKIISLYNEKFSNLKTSPTDKELIDFIKNNALEKKENRKTIIIALERIVGLEKIRRVFDIIEEKRPFDSKMELFEMWLKKQKNQK